MTPGPRQFAFLYGLRGLAALSVLALHTLDHALVDFDTKRQVTSPVVRFASLGHHGPALFFIASAFILFHSLRERKGSERHPRRNFFLRRAFRILPLWWGLIALMAWQNPYPFEVIFWNASMLFGVVGFWKEVRISDVQWTLFVEETFYVLLPFVFERLSSRRRAFHFVVMALVVRGVWRVSAPSLGARYGFIDIFPLNHWHYMALGILLYHLLELSPRREIPRTIKAVGALAAIVLLCTPSASLLAVSLALCLLFISAHDPQTLLGKLCRSRWLRPFGLYCYSIYLFHLPLIEWSRVWPLSLHPSLGVEIAFLITYPLMALLCLGIGAVLHWAIERPIIVWGAALIVRWDSPPQRELSISR